MSDVPERIAVWPDFVGHPSMTGQWSANTHPDNAVAYVRADLSYALLREAMEALQNMRGHLDTPIARRKLGIDHDTDWLRDARVTLATLAARGGDHE